MRRASTCVEHARTQGVTGYEALGLGRPRDLPYLSDLLVGGHCRMALAATQPHHPPASLTPSLTPPSPSTTSTAHGRNPHVCRTWSGACRPPSAPTWPPAPSPRSTT